ncbi:hypothetical protein THUN1379_14120 [Paludibacterium sp. THUN1379]|uniref:RNA pseudouridine synthase n=1 Tax=Paludibacterium sp. THUN1379 TaxID=3112107 RepID=UPI00308A4416|nr:hypothetical protein THUN1379_14120 [Paludibacterium sp. THUN1379]
MDEPQGIRLAKRMVELGMCSRREADEYIEQGLVKVDGQVVRVLGSRVRPEQQIELTRPATPLSDAPVTLLFHQGAWIDAPWSKRLGQDNRWEADQAEQVFLPRHTRQLSAFGATDPASSGLIVLTQDRRLLKKLAECEMEFLVAVAQAPALAALKIEGFSGKINRQSDRQLRIVMPQPASGQIGELCQQLDCPALSIRCIRVGRLALGKLPENQWRYQLGWERF